MEAPEKRPLGNPQGLRALRVEAPEPVVLDQRETECGGAVVRPECDDVVFVPADPVPRLELADLDRKADALHAEAYGGFERPTSAARLARR